MWSQARADRPQNRRKQPTCRRGHPITGRRANGTRYCIECSRIRSAKWYDRQCPQPTDEELDRRALQNWPAEWGRL